jgi:hypothetical protein
MVIRHAHIATNRKWEVLTWVLTGSGTYPTPARAQRYFSFATFEK